MMEKFEFYSQKQQVVRDELKINIAAHISGHG